MELTKEQQKVINRYRIMPSFLQSRNLVSMIYKLQRNGISMEEATQLIFQNSSKNIKTKHFDKFTRNMWNNREAFQKIIDFLKNLPIQQQNKVLKNVSDFTLTLSIGNVSPEIQEKYFERFISNELSMYHIGDLNPAIRKLHEEEILNGSRANAKVLDDMWDVLSTESKSKYYDLYLQSDVPAYHISNKWGELNEQGQQKHMAIILELYDSKQCEFNEYMWASTKDNVQSQYLNMFINAIRKNGKESESILKRLWENTNDTVQNSPVGRAFIESVSIAERKELYKVSNSKLQSQLLAQDIRKYINSEYDFNSPLVQDLFNAKDKVYEMNFQYLFANIKQNIDYLNTFLNACPDEVKEQYSSAIGKYFSSNLELFVNSGMRYQDMLIRSANYLDANSSGILIENFFSRGLEEAKKELTFYGKLGLDYEPSVAEEYWKAIKIEKQKDIYTNFIENDKLKEQINKLYNMMNFENFEDAKIYFIKYFEKYNPEKKDIVLSRLEKINGKNNTITSTINFDFIASDLMDSLTDEQMLRITLYPKVQEELVKNKDNKSFINAFANMLKTNENWTLAADYIFKNIDARQYDELLLEINENEISPEYYGNLSIILSKPNYFGIKSKEDVERYFDVDGKRNQMLLAIMRGEDVELPDSIKDFSQEDLKKFAISEYLYGMDLEALSKYEIRFQGIHGLEIENSEYIKQLVTGISNLNNANIEELDEIINDILEGKILPTEYLKDIHLDSKTINLFSKAFERGVYNPKNYENDQIQQIDYNGSNINVYGIHDDFKMLARVEGAYNSALTSIPDYREFYDNPNISAHGNCESVIGQDQIGLARNKNGNIVVGYASLPQNSMLVSAPYDLGTTNRSLAPLHDNLHLDLKFYGLQEMIDNTRHTHNETVMERLLVDEHGNVQKLRPSYLIWVEDRKTDKFPPEFIEPPEDNENAMLKYKAQVHLWEETQRAAHELGVPIVIINREECAEKETEKIDDLQKILKGELELPAGKNMVDIAKEAIVKFENNAVGLEFAESDVQAKFFTQDQRENLISTIMNVLEQMPEIAYEERYKYLSQVTEIIQQESSKFSADGIRADEQIREYYDAKAKLLEDELIKYEEYIGKESDIDFTIPKEIKEIFETDIRSIANTDYYEDNKAHSIEHIEKVMLFSLMLAKNEGLDDKDTKVLLAAAAFHDSYRAGNDGHGEHAIGSAKKAKEYFESNLDNSYGVDAKDIPLIQVAIAYHEYEEKIKGKVDRTQISKLCEEYGYKGDFERVVQISTILKDADALDRERFGTRGKLNPEYLRTDSAKSRKMVLFAQKVNGIYAKKMIERNHEVDGQVNKFNAVKILQSKRKENSTKAEDKIIESPLSVDEMLELFDEIEKEYTKSPSDIDKKKEVIKAFTESEVTSEDITKAKKMLGIDSRNHTIEQTK